MKLSQMASFEYRDAPVPLRSDLSEAHRRAWQRLARPGTWWSGSERVAIAAEARRARTCSLCRERRAALSPAAVEGEHDFVDGLPPAAIEVIHRLVSDAGRLSRSWYEKVRADGLGDGRYVEIVGVVVAVVSIDSFHVAMGLPLEPLPDPETGEPSHYRPESARDGGAYVPMIPATGNRGAESDLWPLGRTANVIRAMSLVPDEVRSLTDLSAAHYFAVDEVANPAARREGLDRSQIELLAGRVSALNECFY